MSEAASRKAKMTLGEIVVKAIDAKRAADTDAVVKKLKGIAKQVNARKPTHELDAINLAILAAVDEQDELQAEVDGLAKEWDGRVQMRLLGPLAAYDFVVTRKPKG